MIRRTLLASTLAVAVLVPAATASARDIKKDLGPVTCVVNALIYESYDLLRDGDPIEIRCI